MINLLNTILNLMTHYKRAYITSICLICFAPTSCAYHTSIDQIIYFLNFNEHTFQNIVTI